MKAKRSSGAERLIAQQDGAVPVEHVHHRLQGLGAGLGQIDVQDLGAEPGFERLGAQAEGGGHKRSGRD